MTQGSTQHLIEVSTRNHSWGGKGGRCLGLTTLPHSFADSLEILVALTSCSRKGFSRPVMWELLPFTTQIHVPDWSSCAICSSFHTPHYITRRLNSATAVNLSLAQDKLKVFHLPWKSCERWSWIRPFCYRWSWFEARSKICSAERQAKLRGKNKVKCRTYSKRIPLVCSTIYWYIVKVWTLGYWY